MKAVIEAAIEDVLKELGVSDVSFVVEHPTELSHGDYACNVALVAAKQAGENPRQFAEQIAATLKDQIEYVDKIEIAGPGFINFFLARDFFTGEIDRIEKESDHWGANDSLAGQKIVVEYTDPNPFKEFHIGHLFTNSVGESIARLCMASGADVKRVCYQGDVGMHVAHALWGMQQMGITSESAITPKVLGEAYAKGATAYKEDESAQTEIKAINKKIYERSDDSINALYDAGRKVSLEYFEEIYKIVDTQFDHYFFESEAGPKGKELVLAHTDVFPESDGAHVFKGEEYGLHTRVFLNSEGLPTYEAKELALAKMKAEVLGAYDHSIISTANEINEYFKVLLKAMSFVYPELAAKTEHIGHGMVRLTTGKMSSRTGDVISAIDFIGEITEGVHAKAKEAGSTTDDATAQKIAIGAIKYATLKGNILHDAVFDREQALSFEGSSGPYLQYTHARITSVLEKAKEAGITASTTHAPETPYEIEKLLYRLPEIVLEATEERAPHHLVTYLIELAGAFNTFYGSEKIADADDEFAPYKAALAKAVQTTIRNGLWGLAIEAPARM